MLPSGSLLPKIPSFVTGPRSPQQCSAMGPTVRNHHRVGIKNYPVSVTSGKWGKCQRCKCARKEEANEEIVEEMRSLRSQS